MTEHQAVTESMVADRILREYHRRLTHLKNRQMKPGSKSHAQTQGELIGLRGALGIALGGEVPGGGADRLAQSQYAQWVERGEGSSAACACSLCAGGSVA